MLIKKLSSDQEKTPLAQSEDLGNSLHNVQKLLKRNEVKILYFFYFSSFRVFEDLSFGVLKNCLLKKKENFGIGLDPFR